jgi:hypothetical protein
MQRSARPLFTPARHLSSSSPSTHPLPAKPPPQCADIVNGVAPALFDWLRLGTDAGEMCAEVGVCGKPPALFGAKVRALLPAVVGVAAALNHPPVNVLLSSILTVDGSNQTTAIPQAAAPRRTRAAAARSNDMTCPLCMFVITKVKESLSDPVTRQSIHDKTTAACGALPEGGMRDTCTAWAGQYEETIFNFVDTMEATDLCALVGSCSVAERLAGLQLPTLSRGAVEVLAAPVQRAAALKVAARVGGPASNDNCDACKVRPGEAGYFF